MLDIKKIINDKINEIKKDGPAAGSRIVIAMSGGVDSSVAAALYQRAGFEVIGITMQLEKNASSFANSKRCCGSKDVHDARMVADKMGFPHYLMDFSASFQKEVIDDFIASYSKGETPIPCIKCNQTCKFVDLLAATKKLNGEALVTGHYVRRLEANKGKFQLLRSTELDKDQSYFLFTLTQDQLAFSRFPLGSWSKAVTRQVAKELSLTIHQKSESQDICFVSDGRYSDFIAKNTKKPATKGNIVNSNGKILISHDGIENFTIGQRKKLGIGGLKKPLYVIDIDVKNNQVTVGEKEMLEKQTCLVKDLHLLDIDENIYNKPLQVKVRSRMERVEATLKKEEDLETDRVSVHFKEPCLSIAPGQACVIYDGERVVGGAWITKEGSNRSAPLSVNSLDLDKQYQSKTA